jgi:hypothetical protein
LCCVRLIFLFYWNFYWHWWMLRQRHYSYPPVYISSVYIFFKKAVVLYRPSQNYQHWTPLCTLGRPLITEIPAFFEYDQMEIEKFEKSFYFPTTKRFIWIETVDWTIITSWRSAHEQFIFSPTSILPGSNSNVQKIAAPYRRNHRLTGCRRRALVRGSGEVTTGSFDSENNNFTFCCW